MEHTLTKHYEAIIWDWNGTLLDDLEICIDAMNMMLHKRGYKLLEKQHYKEIFTFPVRDYYERVGFDFEKHDWETIALEFIRNYRDLIHKSLLHDRVNEVVSYFQTAGKRQFILSAMHQDFLVETISARLDPSKFEIIAGLGDHYAESKAGNAHILVDKTGLSKDRIVMIGDTIHDYEVAHETGIDCILVADGHQSKERLETTGTKVLNNLGELIDLFN